MDNLVKEVEDNIKPIRAEKMDGEAVSGQPEKAGEASAKAGDAGDSTPDKDIYLHVHRENVKCYRNTQAVINEKTDALKQELEKRCSGIKGLLIGILILSLIDLGASAYLILHMVFGII